MFILISGSWGLPAKITREEAEALNGIAVAKKRLGTCQYHAVYPPHFIVHRTEMKIQTEKSETKTLIQPPKGQTVETVVTELQKDTVNGQKVETALSEEMVERTELAPKILCPIHDLYQED